MSTQLSETEVRVLACLVEKQLTTPEYYPLTMNALTAACNQKSNRDPVMSLSETDIQNAVDRLRDLNLVYLFYGSGSRTVKYKHMLPNVYELDAGGTAIMAVLMLRGPQTIGEIRERSGRMHEFTGLDEVQSALDDLAGRDEQLLRKLERRPGQKDSRYAHLLAGEPAEPAAAESDTADRSPTGGSASRIDQLESELRAVKEELADLKQRFDEFRSQF